MVTIKVTDYGMLIMGHADYAEYGKDIVCESVTVLAQTLELRGTAEKHEGYMKIYTDDKNALELITEGLKQIAINYPEYVEVIC